ATRSWRPLALVAATVLLVTLAAIRWLPGAPGALEVDATFFRAFGEQELRLRPGARLEAGDELFLEVRGTRDMWTYVFSEDDAGEMYVLFPLEGCDVANPLPADRTTRLPGTFDRKPGKWTATSSGGREHLFVVASTSPLNELEDEIARAPQASPGTPVHLGAESVRRLGVRRGIGGVALDEAPDSGGGSALARLFREFAERSGDENLWTWSITLENPEG
ncbi:MAG TPA: DUF4384 domain-containing protein, partial [bacterium]|nr:DUF4384 domain-containing protein [bacterium]